MILKTALELRGNHKLPNAFYLAFMEDDNYAYFRCDCDKAFKLRNTNSFLTYDDIQCPDCKRIGRLKKNIGERYIFKRVKWDAKKAGRSFNLSFDWFVKAIHEPCHYCNRTDINKVSVASKKPGEFLLVDFRYNGLDRVDNALGYEESNCVPCCVVCNRAKNSMPYDDFIEYIEALVNHKNSQGDDHVSYDYAVPNARIPYRGRHRKAGNDSLAKELPKDSISVSTSQFWPHIYYGDDGEVWYSYSGSSYRKLERTI